MKRHFHVTEDLDDLERIEEEQPKFRPEVLYQTLGLGILQCPGR